MGKLGGVTLSEAELRVYMESVRDDRDVINAINTAGKEAYAVGYAEGYAEATKRIARRMLSIGIPMDEIMNYTKLSKEEIGKLK